MRVKSVLYLLFLVISSLDLYANESKRELFVIPGLLRWEGIGPLYGLGLGMRRVTGERIDLTLGSTFGKNQAYGVLLSDIPTGLSNMAGQVYYVDAKKARFESSYTRGLEDDKKIEQEIAARVYGLNIQFKPFAPVWTFSLGYRQSLVSLEDFFDEDGNRIQLPNAFLSDVESSSLLANISYSNLDDESVSTKGFRAKLDWQMDTGRLGQSDQMKTDVSVAGFFPLSSWVVASSRWMFSYASILKRKDAYDTVDETKEGLKIDCDVLTNTDELTACRNLRDQLSRYITANNRFGLASPLGGNRTLRGFREMRFRASQVELISAELRFVLDSFLGMDVLKRRDHSLHFVPFYDVGFAADSTSQLFKESKSSTGLSLRLFLKSLPLRLSVARGDGETVWFFTVGNVW